MESKLLQKRGGIMDISTIRDSIVDYTLGTVLPLEKRIELSGLNLYDNTGLPKYNEKFQKVSSSRRVAKLGANVEYLVSALCYLSFYLNGDSANLILGSCLLGDASFRNISEDGNGVLADLYK